MAVRIQKARLDQVKAIHGLIKVSAEAGQMLPRPLGDIYECIRDFVVVVDTKSKEIVGCCALHVTWENLAEVRSLSVKESYRTKGLGRRLVTTCLDDARALKLQRVFALTYVTGFFKKLAVSCL